MADKIEQFASKKTLDLGEDVNQKIPLVFGENHKAASDIMLANHVVFIAECATEIIKQCVPNESVGNDDSDFYFDLSDDGIEKFKNEWTKEIMEENANSERKNDDDEIGVLLNDYYIMKFDDSRFFKNDFADNRGIESCAIAFHCWLLADSRNAEKALDLIIHANYRLGVASEYRQGIIDKKEFARVNANKRHAENHDMKRQAIEYYIENKNTFNSKDDAAEKISNKIVPVSPRTVRDWLKGI